MKEVSYKALSVRHQFAVLAVLSFVALVIAQFFILSSLGTKGPEITSIREQKAELREEIESLQASIDEAKTLKNIENGLAETFHLEPKAIKTVTVPNNLTASVF
jgi:phage shock protein PspC (stress-responsive transcriptional regulator)